MEGKHLSLFFFLPPAPGSHRKFNAPFFVAGRLKMRTSGKQEIPEKLTHTNMANDFWPRGKGKSMEKRLFFSTNGIGTIKHP